MSEAFDPYFKWLGIPPSEQPPNHYRLLGIPAFTSDPDVIQHASDQRMAHVRSFSGGQHAGESQRILNEISTAKVTLLSNERKDAYDTKLRSESTGPEIHRPTPRETAAAIKPIQPRNRRAIPIWIVGGIVAVVGLALLVVVAAAGMFLLFDSVPLAVDDGVIEPASISRPAQNLAAPEDNSEKQPTGNDEETRPTHVPDDGDEKPDFHVDQPDRPPAHTADEDFLAAADNPAVASNTTPNEKAAVPDAAVRRAADQEVIEVFGKEIAQAKTNDQQRAVAERLIQVGARTPELPIRFALFRKAIDLSEEIGDARVAFRAIDELDKSFEGDALRLKASVLHGISEQLRRGEGHVELAEHFALVIDLALSEDRYDIAQPLTVVALQSAIKSGSGDLRKNAVLRVKEVEALAKQFEEVKTALTTLRVKPTDPQANLVAGKYYCFVREDWSEGLTFLALASDEQLKALADEELKVTPDAMTLGDGWWRVAEELGEPQSINVKRRAAQHYLRVLPTLKGFAKAAVEKRLSELPAVQPKAKIVDLIALSDAARHGENGRWKKVDTGLVGTNLQDASFFSPPYSPPSQYDLQVSFTRTHNGPTAASDTHIRIPHGDDCHVFGIRAHKDGSTSLSFWGDKPFGAPPLGVTARPGIAMGRKHTLLFRVRDAGVQALLDGRPLFTVGDYSLLRNTEDGIALGSYQNETVFHEMVVREILPPSLDINPPPRARPVTSLFNGRDLTGWRYMPIAYSKSKTNKTWIVNRAQNALVSTGGDDFNDLGTEDTYTDFTLSLQWRFRPGGPVNPNGSGIVVRADGMDGRKHNPRGIEIDIRPNHDVEKRIGTGCLIAYATPLKNHQGAVDGKDQRLLGWLRAPALKEGEGWNDCVITCRGDSLVVEMNGEVVNRAWGIQIPKGNVVLRNQKTAVEFRDIRLVKLAPSP